MIDDRVRSVGECGRIRKDFPYLLRQNLNRPTDQVKILLARKGKHNKVELTFRISTYPSRLLLIAKSPDGGIHLTTVRKKGKCTSDSKRLREVSIATIMGDLKSGASVAPIGFAKHTEHIVSREKHLKA